MSSRTTNITDNVVLRLATAADEPALTRLAQRDSDVVPALPILLAESDGSLLAAWSLSEQRAIADPFVPTAHLLELLRNHAGNGAASAGGGRSAPHALLGSLRHAGPRAA